MTRVRELIKQFIEAGAYEVENTQLLFLEENIQVDIVAIQGGKVSLESLLAVGKMVEEYNNGVNDNLRLCASFYNDKLAPIGEIINAN